MAWFGGKVSLGNFADLAGAVNKISESVKNIEKNFDSALGFEEKSDSSTSEASGLWPSTTDRKTLFEPVMAFMGHQGGESTVESIEKPELLKPPSSVEEKQVGEIDRSTDFATEQTRPAEEVNEESSHMLPDAAEGTNIAITDGINAVLVEPGKSESDLQPIPVELSESNVEYVEEPDSLNHLNQKETSAMGPSESSESVEAKPGTNEVDQVEVGTPVSPESHNVINLHEITNEQKAEEEEVAENLSPVQAEDAASGSQAGMGVELTGFGFATSKEIESDEGYVTDTLPDVQPPDEAAETVSESVSHENDTFGRGVDLNEQASDYEPDIKEQRVSSGSSTSVIADSVVELEKLKREMKMMETALQGAARQAQAKADDIAKLMNENEHQKAVIEDLRRKSNEAEIESLREEYHHKVAALERKVYALTKERDTLRREQSKKSDAAALLKEKDEIINQVMAEGEELSKKQAAQESQIRKLRAQIRDLEEEKKGLTTKLQVEENKVESIKRDKAETEKLLQETMENHQAELAVQKEFYTNALNAAKEAEALAEARASNEAKTELDSRLKEAEERETMLVQALEELRQTLSRTEQQAVFREDMLRRDVEDLQKRYQASERRCEELVTQVPESTRPLLRQIEYMQETTARRAEAWAAVERSLSSRLQEAEAKAAAAQERERSINERLSQTLSRLNVLEAQISCLRSEQTQLSRSLEKERQRAAENRQEYLAAKEEADTHEGRVSQLEEEIRELRRKQKQELHEALMHRELLQQEIDREKAARLELERTAHLQPSTVSDQSPITRQKSGFENGTLSRKLSSASSLGSMEESFFLQASLDSSDNFSERRNIGEMATSPYFMKSMPPSAFEASLRQKEGELASYMSRLASLESIRDSLAEELVKMTAQCEKLRVEATMLPGIRAELEALRRRHSAALELMGERDEELEELRADIVDLKEMYREQVNMLVNKIQVLSSS
ncbi:golgin candidate 5-like [Camellia sinensis]|uniref:golgin candidate 5-like n=1 Tax=Camellia sinensis TaxID=4442 RepID=UPI001036A71A|nr:golgin candidate 5-like [Camellia sinensis]XP_028127398.1 golgin candidate 5-like [Camellia sinensis]XP_028127399.1 golgin candidate 5-like [Camellia sinensis]